jgi:HAD superfamily hydrolase (TIGR01509 family)
MDGLLFDTEKLYWSVGDAVLGRRGLRYCNELQRRMMGRVGVAATTEMKQFHNLPDSAEDLLAESEQLYLEQLSGKQADGGIDSMPGLSQWIDCLIESDLPFGLATSSRRKFVDVIFDSIPWRQSLAFVLTGDDVRNGKPHPEMYLKAAERLAIPASEMLVLEDSENGCKAAVAAGAVTVAIPNPHTQSQDFTGVWLVASSLADPRLHALLES